MLGGKMTFKIHSYSYSTEIQIWITIPFQTVQHSRLMLLLKLRIKEGNHKLAIIPTLKYFNCTIFEYYLAYLIVIALTWLLRYLGIVQTLTIAWKSKERKKYRILPHIHLTSNCWQIGRVFVKKKYLSHLTCVVW